MFHGPVFVPSADDKLKAMLELAQIKPGMKVADLGSGDGKVMIAAAHQGAEVDGFEINSLLVWRSRRRLKTLGLADQAKVYSQSFWKTDFSNYDVIFIYGTTYIMQRLEKKLQAEIGPKTKVISNYFQFPTWLPAKEKNDVRLYTKDTV